MVFYYRGSMTVLISGVLINAASAPLIGYQITLKAQANSSDVVMHTVAVITTDVEGRYEFVAQKGKYNVYLKPPRQSESYVGEIVIDEDAGSGTLNDFLLALNEEDLTPEVVKRFEAMVAQAQESAGQAQQCEQNAAQHAHQAEQYSLSARQSRDESEGFAASAQQFSEATAVDRHAAAEYAQEAGKQAQASEQSAQKSAAHSATAELAKNDIQASLNGVLKKANCLSEIAAEGVSAQRMSRENLGLKSGAMMEMQSDIYDRTDGRIALPGAFGYGACYQSVKYFSPNNGTSEFLSWVTENPPGKYAVCQTYGPNYNPILSLDGKGINFTGIVEIEIPDSLAINEVQSEKDKLITFYGVNGEICTNRLYYGRLTGWEKLKLKISDFTRVLYSTTGNRWGSPEVGGIIMAAYQGENDSDKNKTLIRGRSYPGSRLGMLTIATKSNTTGSYASSPQFFVENCYSYPQAGTFIALSGNSQITLDDTDVAVGLFIRIA